MLTHIVIAAIAAQVAAIEGQVLDARTHTRISLARVELLRMLTPMDRQVTDRDGRFVFARLPEGRYTISVEYNGYETVSVGVDMDGTRVPVVVELVRTKPAPSNERTVVSVQQLMAPEPAQKEFEVARKYSRQGQCDKAIAHFESGLREFAKDAAVHNDLGNCYRKLERLDMAESEFKRALSLSDSQYVSMNLAEVYTAQKRFKEAEAVLNDAVRRRPNAGDAYYGLAVVYFAQELMEETKAAALEADKRLHRIADVHLILAEIYWRQNESGSAAEQLKLYLSEAPNGSQSERVRETLERMRN